jgi:o-succinylbenzoate synthase
MSMNMSISEVLVHRIRVPLVRQFVTAQRSTRVHDAVLVELRDGDGRSGWGEAPCSWRVTGESPESVIAAVGGPIGDAVRGRQLQDLDDICRSLASSVVQNSAAKMAVECALYDLAAQHAGVPLAVFLGGECGLVRTDMTLAAGTPDEVAAAAFQYAAAGFGVLKVKCGAGGDDRAILRAVREVVGKGVVLRVDANQGWSVREAVEIIRDWEDNGLAIELVEQPVAARDLDGLAAVHASVATPILADESVWNGGDLRQLLRRGAADLVNLKLAKAGGISECVRMAELAAEHGVGLLVGSMMESQVGVAAAASLAAALFTDRELAQDLDAGLWMHSSPVHGGISYDGDRIRLANSPGLGISGITPMDDAR